nr:hypothetical protein [uncultured Desulfobulbus sp.]
MMDSAFIESIVRRVLSEAKGGTVDATGPKYLILAERQHIDALCIARSLPAGARICSLDDWPEPWNFEAVQEYQGFILPMLSLEAMADLVVGRGNGKIGCLVLQLLLAGHRVEVLEFAYRAYEETAPSALWNLYCSYQEQLEAFGLVERRGVRPAVSNHRGHLLTEKDVEQMARDGVRCIHTGKRTIVTGLARDLARAKGITLLQN